MSEIACRSLASSNRDALRVIFEMVREQLGVNASVRCIVSGDGNGEIFAKDTVEILKCLEIQHPAAVHVIRVCQGHKDVYGCGVKSMLFMMGHLCSQMKQLMVQGIPLFYIETLLQEAIEYCISNLQSVVIRVDVSPLLQKQTTLQSGFTMTFATKNTDQCQVDTFSKALQDYSRNFVASDQLQDNEDNVNENFSQAKHPNNNVCKNSLDAQKQTEWHCSSCKTELGTSGQIYGSLNGNSLHSKGIVPNLCCSSKLNSHPSFKASSLEASCNHHSHPKCFVCGESNRSASERRLNGFIHHSKKCPSLVDIHQNVIRSSRHLQLHSSTDKHNVINQPKSENSTTHSENEYIHSSRLSNTSWFPTTIETDDCEPSATSVEIPSFCTKSDISHCEPSATSVETPSSITKSDISQDCRKSYFQATGSNLGDTQRSLCLPEDAEDLSHGCTELMSWAKEVMCCQLQHGKLSRFNMNLVNTKGIRGHQSAHRLIHGLLVDVHCQMMEAATKFTCPVSALLINGDATADFKHMGYKSALSVKRATCEMQSLHLTQKNWHSQVFLLLEQLKVQVMFVRGLVDCSLKEEAVAGGIVLIDHVPFSALKVLQTACQVDFVTYVLEAHKGNVCHDVSFSVLLEDWSDTIKPGEKQLVIRVPAFIQTLVISEPSTAGREMKEEEFWHCTSRLAQAMEDKKVLIGEGVTEQFCADLLNAQPTYTERERADMRWPGEVALYRASVRAALADAFLAYTATVDGNRRKSGHSTGRHFGVGQHVYHNTSLSSQSTSLHSQQLGLLTCHIAHDSSSQKCEDGKGSKCENGKGSKCEDGKGSTCEDGKGSTCEDGKGSTCEDGKGSTCEDGKGSKCEDGKGSTCEDGKGSKCEDGKGSTCEDGKGSTCEDGKGSNMNPEDRDFLSDCQIDKSAGSYGTLLQAFTCGADDSISQATVCDNYSSKVNGWRSAISCLSVVLRMDGEIITGIERKTDPSMSVLL